MISTCHQCEHLFDTAAAEQRRARVVARYEAAGKELPDRFRPEHAPQVTQCDVCTLRNIFAMLADDKTLRRQQHRARMRTRKARRGWRHGR